MATLNRSRRAFGLIGRFVRGVSDAVYFVHQVNRIASTPESVFRAEGTTREQALRDHMFS